MPYAFQLTKDVALIKSIMGHEACYRHLHDDHAPPREEWEPPFIEGITHYVACSKDSDTIGMFMCSMHSREEVEIHTAFLPRAWGHDVRTAVREAIQWVWDTFPAVHRIIGKILRSNVASLRYAEAVGLKAFGIDERSFMFGGKLQDQVYVGISREAA